MPAQHMPIDDVPPEIWQKVANAIDSKSDFLRLRFVCRLYHAVFTPFAISSMGIEIASTPRNFFGDHSFYLDFIRAFEPIPEIFVKYITSLSIDLAYTVDFSTPTPALTRVWEELSRFSGLKELRITCARFRIGNPFGLIDTELMLPKVLDPIIAATDGHLKCLVLNLTQSRQVTSFPSALNRVHGLETFEFFHTCDKEDSSPTADSSSCLSQLRSIVSSNPFIRTFNYSRHDPKGPASLSDIFPSQASFLNLERVMVYGHLQSACRDDRVLNLPRLNRLQRLHMFHDMTTPVVNIDQFWMSLRSSGTVLKSLNTIFISPELLVYLASYRGLQDCTLLLQEQVHTPSFSVTSIQQAFMPHGATLERLAIHVYGPDMPNGFQGCSFAPSGWMDPSFFPALRALAFPLLFELQLTEENYALMLEFASRFPSLDVLTIRWRRTVDSETKSFQKQFRTTTGRPHKIIIEHDTLKKSEFTNVVLLEDIPPE